ncbi:MAG: hypothetical protein KDB61_07445, partial [Planctomycetes bacterium]|nr:hypothetical protein [Planctomycetota bacterium]
GHSIALDGDRMAVGMSSYDATLAFSPSLIAIYERQNGVWIQTQLLDEINSEPVGGHAMLGYSVALKGDCLVAGAPGVRVAGEPERQIRVYRDHPGTGFQLETILRNSQDRSTVVNSSMGKSIGVDFDRGLIAAGDPLFTYQRPDQTYFSQGIALLFDMELGQTTACDGTNNSTYHHSHLAVTGSLAVADGHLNLHASHLPPGEFSLFLYGQPGAPFPLVTGGELLAIRDGGPIYRLLPPGPVGELGERYLEVALQTGIESHTLLPGTTWAFQALHRDTIFGMSTTGTTNAVLVTLD